MTVLEVIQRGTKFLAGKGVESPRLQVELLLAHALGVPRLNLYLQFERELTGETLDHLREGVQRRGRREPLQYILGSAAFCGLEFRVSSAVLIPRPETELLAEQAWQFLARAGGSAPRVLDYGTGSGCLAVTLALKCPAAAVHAVDVSAAALEVARDNATRHGVAERLRFYCGDGFATLPAELIFDLIVANPPYLRSGDLASLEPEVRDHEPQSALDGGPDGLRVHACLAAGGAARLRRPGCLMVELGDGQEQPVVALLVRHNWIVERVEADYSGRPRILTARPAGA